MITTHILDVSIGKPAAGVRVTLSRVSGASRSTLGSGVTDADGRLRDLLAQGETLQAGTFELVFETGDYFARRGERPFHPRITVTFDVTDGSQHHHVPLLLSAFGFTTYRGS
jgi:5-hydroxyisourate hydrolase